MATATEELLHVLGKNVLALRRAKGYSQERLAEAADLHRTYVGGIERGERNVSFVNIAYLARALDVLPSDLVRGVTRHMLDRLPDGHRSSRTTRSAN